MIKRVKSLLLMVACALVAQAATEKIRIMSFNIPYKNVVTATNPWESISAHLCAYVDSISPDLMGWQEPVRAELIDLLSGMPGYAMVGWGRDDGKEKGEYTPILYKTERFYVEASGNYWLTDTPDVVSRVQGAAHNRIATWAVMVDKETGARFIYTNTHLSYETPEVKEAQIRVLKPHMQELNDIYGSSLPHMLTGDFNMPRRESDNYTYVKNLKLAMNDMYMIARKKANLNGGDEQGCIDYIYATKNVSCTYAEWGSKLTADGCTMSDHNPVWADISWTTSNEDNARATVTKAWEVIDSLTTYTATRTKLATNTTGTTDGMETNHPLSMAFDGSTSTYCQSLANLPPNQPHYVQIALNRQITDCRFDYYRRNDNTGLNDRWQDIKVTASEDGTNWDYITEFTDFGGTVAKAYTSDVIHLHKSTYKHLRFSIMRTPSMTLRNGAPQFSAAEFQLYPNTPKTDSPRYETTQISEAADALETAIAATQAKIDAHTIVRTDVTALQTAITALRKAVAEKETGIVGLQASDNDQQSTAVFNLAGQRVDKTQKGLVIRKGKKMIVK